MFLHRKARSIGLAVSFAVFALLAFAQAPDARSRAESLTSRIRQSIGGRNLPELLRERAVLLSELMESDPQAALSLALTPEERAGMLEAAPDAADAIETMGQWSGTLEVAVADDFEHHRSRRTHRLRTASRLLDLSFADSPPASSCGQQLDVDGLRLGDRVVAQGAVVREVGATCTPLGDQKTVVILLNLPSKSLPATTTASFARNAILGGATRSSAGFWSEASYGRASASGVVLGPYTLPADYTCNQTEPILSAAMSAADGVVDFRNYTRIFLVTPLLSGNCGWAGLGTVGCRGLSSADGSFNASVSWIIDQTTSDALAEVVAHEGGHNFGLDHASTVDYGAQTLGAPRVDGVHDEYGDSFSNMGSAWLFGHWAAPQKKILGWFAASNTQDVETAGTFVLVPAEINTTSLQAIRVRRGSGNNLWLWIEYRQPLGYDTQLRSQGYAGVVIHYEDPQLSGLSLYSELLDFTPTGTPNLFDDAPLASGRSWSDPYTNLTLQISGANAQGVTVTVGYGAPCATISPTSRSHGSEAESGTISVSGAGSCAWSATTATSWITITSGSSGAGAGTVGYSIPANTGATSRSGQITVANQTFTVSQAARPQAISVTPAAGSGSSQVFAFAYSDSAAYTNLSLVEMNINASTATNAACYVHYDVASRAVTLRNDGNTGWLGPLTLGAGAALQNSQCVITGAASSAIGSGTGLTVNLSIGFFAGFAGSKRIYMQTQNSSYATGWQQRGTWTATAPTTPVLSITKTHGGDFVQGQTGATYTIVVSNSPSASATSGTVTVTDAPPSGLTIVSMSGTGWTCASTCTRSGSLAPGASYPAITVTVNVSAVAPASVTNQATVSGGGSAAATANDSTRINAISTGLGFVPVAPCRIVDTRPSGGKSGAFGGPALAAGTTRDIPIPSGSCGIPATAGAYSLNVTAAPRGYLGYLSVWPSGSAFPMVSTLNSFTGAIVANAAIVPAGTSGSVAVMASDATDVIIDINGYYTTPTAQTLLFYPLTPCRIVDTRPYGGKGGAFGPPALMAGGTRSFPVTSSSCSVPASAQAYSLNFTASAGASLGYLTTWATGQAQPLASTLNAPRGGIVANAAVVPAGTGGSINVFSSDTTDLIIDINGYFAPPGQANALAFYPVTSCRVADTRSYGGKTGEFGPPAMAGGATRNFTVPNSSCGIPAAAQAYSLNMSVWPAVGLQYLTTWPAGQARPYVSTLNAFTGGVVANAAIVPAGANRAVSIFVSDTTDLFFDINGYFAP